MDRSINPPLILSEYVCGWFQTAVRLTLRLHLFSSLSAGFAVAVTADVIEGEQKMMSVRQLNRQLYFKLDRQRQVLKEPENTQTHGDVELTSHLFIKLWALLVV